MRQVTASLEARAPAMPFVGSDRRDRCRQVDRAGGAGALRRGGPVDRRGRARAVRAALSSRAVLARFGAAVAPGGVVDRARACASAHLRPPRIATGSRGSCGRWWGRGWPPGAISVAAKQPAAARDRRRGAAAVRGWDGERASTRRSPWSRQSGCAASARRHAATARCAQRGERQLTQEREGAARDLRRRQRRRRGRPERKLSSILDMLGR